MKDDAGLGLAASGERAAGFFFSGVGGVGVTPVAAPASNEAPRSILRNSVMYVANPAARQQSRHDFREPQKSPSFCCICKIQVKIAENGAPAAGAPQRQTPPRPRH